VHAGDPHSLEEPNARGQGSSLRKVAYSWSPPYLLRLGGRRKNERENDGEPDPPDEHLGWNIDIEV
jgi:hypothetical protein